MHFADFRMFQLYPLRTLSQLRIAVNVFHGVDDCRSDARCLKFVHHLLSG